MHVRCPACGAQASLEVMMIANDGAAQALQVALEMSDVGALVIRYLALFRPAKSKLSWPRVASLLGELLPLIKQERLERGGNVYEAPRCAWAAALDKTLAARDAGALRTPLTSHGYLYEVVIAEAARASARGVVAMHSSDAVTASTPTSATARAIARLERRKHGGQGG